MSAIIFSEAAARFEPKGDNMLVTFTSGSDTVQIVLPRGAFTATAAGAYRAVEAWFKAQPPGVLDFAEARRKTCKRGKSRR